MANFLDNIKGYCGWLSRFSNSVIDAKRTMNSYIMEEHPSLMPQYKKYFSNPKAIGGVSATQVFAEILCGLESFPFHELKKKTSIFVGATGRIGDDLLDEGKIKPEETFLYLKTKRFDTKNDGQRELFYAFGSKLEKLLPVNFSTKFENICYSLNQAQLDSLKLKDKISKEELLSIKDRTGGYSILMLYSFVFPDFEDISKNLALSCYNPEKDVIPNTKGEALFNLGAWLSKFDDLKDIKTDKNDSLKNLAAEGCTNWKSLHQEINYIFNGLGKFYSKHKTDILKKLVNTISSYNRILSKIID